MVIDGREGQRLVPEKATVFTGSGNSYSAGMRFDENTVIVDGNAEFGGAFRREFSLMWNIHEFEYGEVLVPIDSLSADELPDDARFEMCFTSDNFDLKTTSYGPTFVVADEIRR